jgi:hypothetical protein
VEKVESIQGSQEEEGFHRRKNPRPTGNHSSKEPSAHTPSLSNSQAPTIYLPVVLIHDTSHELYSLLKQWQNIFLIHLSRVALLPSSYLWRKRGLRQNQSSW